MKADLEIIEAWIAAIVQQIGARIDPEVLQWPGGLFIALLLLFRKTG
jgi:hypothetical protein